MLDEKEVKIFTTKDRNTYVRVEAQNILNTKIYM